MKKSTYRIKKMDCPSEATLIKLKLKEHDSIQNIDFHMSSRMLDVYHLGNENEIFKSLVSLKLDTVKINTTEVGDIIFPKSHSNQSQLLWKVLIINFCFFVVEIATGLISKSMGLVADSLDMLADSLVYGISLFAVGGSKVQKKKVALVAGVLQLILALLGFIEIIRRFVGNEQLPDYSTMIFVSSLALIANGYCLQLLQKSTDKEDSHMKASMIFTSNDILINIGVIIAGILVTLLNSGLPDLLVGTLVFILVVQGAIRILKLSIN